MRGNGVSIGVMLLVMVIGFTSLGHRCYQAEQDVTALQTELNDSRALLESTSAELVVAQNNLASESEKVFNLDATLSQTVNELEEANTMIDNLKSVEYEFVYLGEYKLTHYCTERRKHICGTGAGITSTGTQVTAGRTIAVDPSVIPYGTEVYIEGYGWRVAEDCGGAVNGKHIDIAVETHSQATSMGTTTGGVWILVKKGS